MLTGSMRYSYREPQFEDEETETQIKGLSGAPAGRKGISLASIFEPISFNSGPSGTI